MIALLALVALLAFAAGFLAGALWAGADHRAFNRRTPDWSSREYGGEWSKGEWDNAYNVAMQSLDWQTCEQLMVESPYPEHRVRRDEWPGS